METIHQGIAYSMEITSQKPLVSSDIVVSLRNPATGYYTAFLATQQDANTILCELSKEVTAELPIGNYNIEVYYNDKTDILYYAENYARVVFSSAIEVEFVRISYIIVNNLRYERNAIADLTKFLPDENLLAGYAWKLEEGVEIEDPSYATLFTVYEIPSVGSGTYRFGNPLQGEIEGKHYITTYQVTKYTPANVPI